MKQMSLGFIHSSDRKGVAVCGGLAVATQFYWVIVQPILCKSPDRWS